MTNNNIIVTASITLKPLSLEHKEELHLLKQKNKNYLMPYLDWIRFEDENDTNATHNFITMVINGFSSKKSVNYGIFYNNQLAGILGFNSISLRSQIAEIGYWLGEDFTKKGLITQSIPAMLNWWNTNYGIKRFVLKASEHNTASNNIAKRLNFPFEGVLKRAERIGENFYNQNCYALVLE